MPQAPLSDRAIVVGIDGSQASLRAFDWAVAEAAARRTRVLAVHATRLSGGRAPARGGDEGAGGGAAAGAGLSTTHPKELSTMRTIAVGVDGSKGAQLALEWAIAQGQLSDVRIKAVYAAPPAEVVPELIVYKAGGDVGPTQEERIAAAEKLIDEALAAAGSFEAVRVDKEVILGGGPARTLSSNG